VSVMCCGRSANCSIEIKSRLAGIILLSAKSDDPLSGLEGNWSTSGQRSPRS